MSSRTCSSDSIVNIAERHNAVLSGSKRLMLFEAEVVAVWTSAGPVSMASIVQTTASVSRVTTQQSGCSCILSEQAAL